MKHNIIISCSIFCLLLLSSCNKQNEAILQERIDELNQRLDKLEVSSEEILVRANSMSELEMVVKKMEEHQFARLRDVNRRDLLAKKRIVELEADLDAKLKSVHAVEMISESYIADVQGKSAQVDQQIVQLKQNLEAIVQQIDTLKKRLAPE